MQKDISNITFSHTDFTSLMQKRILSVLLICSNYDSFILEEDGRIDDRVFKEYTSLNFRFPPVFLKAHSRAQALEIAEKEHIDLIITMMHGEEDAPLSIARQIKSQQPDIPVVVLMPFLRKLSIMLQESEYDFVDHVFSWLGNAELILSIIKIIEDKINAEHDTGLGTQVILLVDDSIRYVSQVLPVLYKILFRQALDAAKQEGLNEHLTTLRKRARPKILLARSYDEALKIYNTYRKNILGVISDVHLTEDDKGQEGVRLCRTIRKDNPTLPLILQTGDCLYLKNAEDLQAGFVNKHTRQLARELENSITYSFGFGNFVFRKPGDAAYQSYAYDLHDFQRHIRTIPDESFVYHAIRNDFSRWFNTRGLFPIASLFREYRVEDFPTVAAMKNFVYDAITMYRKSLSSNTIAQFNMSNIDHNMMLYRMGEGSIGGKARGLAFLNSIIVSRNLSNVYKNITVKIPKTVFIGTDYFDDFIAMNSLQDAATGTYTDAEIFTRFINAHLPQQLMWNLRAYLTAVSKPLAVRSSSKLEDSYYQPFAGIYATHMVPFTTYTEKFLADVSDAIKAVYASVFMQESKAYIEATSNVIDEEKMAVVLQEVCGNSSGNMQYPLIAGVIRSVNFYPVGPEKAEDGIVSMAVGLGKYVVDNEPSLRFSPACPLSALQGYSADSVLKESQKYFYALDTDSTAYRIDPDEKKNFIRVKLKEASDAAKSLAVSVYDPGNQMITDMPYAEGTPVVTFSKLFRNNDLNFTQLLSDLIQMGKEEMNSDVELEFALEEDAEKKGNYIFNLLQIRPVGTVGAGVNVEVDVAPDQCILYSRQSLGNGIFEGITDVVYVKTESFDPSSNAQLAVEIERINHEMKQQKRSYVLIGPGRWGSSDPWLGIPVKWSQISEASVIAEIGLDNYPVEPSQGTHFFQNITTFCIGYMIVSPQFPESIFDHRYLGSMKPVSESEHIRQIRFPKPLRIIIDGRKNTGAIVKP